MSYHDADVTKHIKRSSQGKKRSANASLLPVLLNIPHSHPSLILPRALPITPDLLIILPKALSLLLSPPLRLPILLLLLLPTELRPHLRLVNSRHSVPEHFIRYIAPSEWREVECSPHEHARHDSRVLVLAVDERAHSSPGQIGRQPSMGVARKWLFWASEVRELGGVNTCKTNMNLDRVSFCIADWGRDGAAWWRCNWCDTNSVVFQVFLICRDLFPGEPAPAR